jgi:outer membrane protein assembly factor BamB
MRELVSRLIWSTVILSMVALSCGRTYRLHKDQVSSEQYACSRGSAAQTGAVETVEGGVSLNLLWKKSVSGKPAGPLAIHNGVLVYPETRKKIYFFDVLTGRQVGRWKAKGVPQTGLALSERVAVFGAAPRRDFLRATDLFSAKRLWQKKVKDVAAGPIIVDNRLFVSSGDGFLRALDLDNGESVWTFAGDQRPSAAASFDGVRIFQPSEQGWLYAVSPDSGKELYRVRLDGSLVSPVAAAQFVYAATVTGRVYALNPNDGSVIWQYQADGPIWTSPAVGHDRIFVGHSGGDVLALDVASGREVWRHEVGEVIRASVLLVGDRLVVGTMTGRLLVLKADDGSLVDSTSVQGAISVAPVHDGQRLFVATQAGKILCFGDRNEQAEPAEPAHQGVNSQLQSE